MSSHKKNVIVIGGPTASGKTAVAIKLAQHFHTEIISADSRQCYKELKIGVARPSEEELAMVPHHFIATHSIEQELSAADFEQYALAKCNELFGQHDVIILAGGTGLYIKAFMEGFDPVPAVDARVRQQIIDHYNELGIEWLAGELKKKDPRFAKEGEMKNPQRMMRALEVAEATGTSIYDFRKGSKAQRPFHIIPVGLELPRAELRIRINDRVDRMIEEGLLSEVRSLAGQRHKNALRTVGYAEIFDHLDGKITLEEAILQIKIHTWQYAKRQLTWFKKDRSFSWFHPAEFREMLNHCSQMIDARE